MSFKRQDFRCVDCGHRFDTLLSKEERENEDYGTCEACDSPDIIKIIGAPLVLKATYLDGGKGRGPGWARYKERIKMDAIMADITDPQERKAAEKERKKLDDAVNKEKHT